jgi:hypothetical protein
LPVCEGQIQTLPFWMILKTAAISSPRCCLASIVCIPVSGVLFFTASIVRTIVRTVKGLQKDFLYVQLPV